MASQGWHEVELVESHLRSFGCKEQVGCGHVVGVASVWGVAQHVRTPPPPLSAGAAQPGNDAECAPLLRSVLPSSAVHRCPCQCEEEVPQTDSSGRGEVRQAGEWEWGRYDRLVSGSGEVRQAGEWEWGGTTGW